MELELDFIKEQNLTDTYIKWLQNKVKSKDATSLPIEPNYMQFAPKRPQPSDFFQTDIEYDVPFLSYQVEIWFHRVLTHTDMEYIENIIRYWGAIPYVSTEGIYGIEWMHNFGMSRCEISVDFTKSASDDYMAREILELLSLWLEEGTPIRKNRTKKHQGVIRALSIKCDCP